MELSKDLIIQLYEATIPNNFVKGSTFLSSVTFFKRHKLIIEDPQTIQIIKEHMNNKYLIQLSIQRKIWNTK